MSWIDSDLRKSYLAAGGACKSAVALMTVASAMQVWMKILEYAINNQLPKEKIIKALDEIIII